MTTATQELSRLPQQPQPLDAVNKAVAIDDLLAKVALVKEVMHRVMVKDEHFGIIPGCKKPSLYKSGAEKLAMVFRLKMSLTLTFEEMGRGHREYVASAHLSDGTEATGSCSTMENKYRWQQGERKCPKCGSATIRPSRQEYGGGFYCDRNKGGCGEKFAKDAAEILSQKIGKVENDNPADFYNTCRQMATKRAFVQAVRTATACSDIFIPEPEDEPGGDEGKDKTLPAPVGLTVQVKAIGNGVPRGDAVFYPVTFTDGREESRAWTSNLDFLKLLKELVETGELALITTKTTPKGGLTLETITRKDQPPE